jgi:hypothetical protein
MSFSDHAIVWLHIVAAVLAIGPGTAAIMATPRYIRKRNVVVLGYLNRTTEIYAVASLVVAVVLRILIMRDKRRAMTALAAADPAQTRRSVLTIRMRSWC